VHLDRDETPTERADRNLAELLQEVRVALPGVQVLFAFLLAVPFQPRFADTTQLQIDVYFGTLLCSAAASALLIFPSAYHRLNFRRGDKEHIVLVAQRATVAGLAALALAMTGAVVLVTDWLFGPAVVAVAAGAVTVMFAGLWFVVPLLRRLRTPDPGGPAAARPMSGPAARRPARDPARPPDHGQPEA
jgi:O-antigen/teichoic acid export membrane protein